MFSDKNSSFDFYSINDIFKNKFKNGFDIVITNPPYKNLKSEKNKFTNNLFEIRKSPILGDHMEGDFL